MKDIKESILSQMGMGDEYIRTQQEQWIGLHKSVVGGQYKINDENEIDAPAANITYDPSFPSYLRFGNVRAYAISGYDGEDLQGIPFPSSCETLSIVSCKNLKSLKGISGKNIGTIRITDCRSLANIEDLKEVGTDKKDIYSGYIIITECPRLKSLKGLPENIGTLKIELCNAIKSIDGIVNVGNLTVSKCSRFDSLEGLPKSVNGLSLVDCPELKSLKGLPKKAAFIQLHGLGETFKREEVERLCKANSITI